MSSPPRLKFRFVEFIPDDLQELTIYISVMYATATHRCPCGCGSKVVTPLSPTDWELIFDGDTVSLYPSVGNWSLPCRSHYWIRRNEVQWAPRWSRDRIEVARAAERRVKDRYFEMPYEHGTEPSHSKMFFLTRFWSWLRR